MSQYNSTDSLARSSRAARSGHLAGSVASSRPFLNLLNPMGRAYRGYRHPEEHLLEEEEEDEEDGDGRSTRPRAEGSGNGRTRTVSWGSGKNSDPATDDTHEVTETETEDDDDEVPQSFMIEAASARRGGRRSSSHSHKRGASGLKLTPISPSQSSSSPRPRARGSDDAYATTPPFSIPPRPSELNAPAVMSPDPQPETAFASTRPKNGLDDYEKALWNWVNVYNLDAYLQEVYDYYTGKGIYCIALSRGLNLLTVGFVISFSTFLLGCIDYSRVPRDGSGRLSDIVIDRCVSRFSGFTFLFFLCFGAFFLFQIADYVRSIMRLVNMYRFFTHLLGIPDGDIQTISWPEVVRRIGQIRDQNPGTAISSNANRLDASALHHSNSPPTAALDAHDIANRIMRQENYLIALFNKELLDLRVPLPPIIEQLVGRQLGKGNALTRALEWNLRYCLLGYLFDNSGRVRKTFLKEKNRNKIVEQLQRRFIFMGVLNAIFAPFIVLYLLMYSFFRYFAEYHKNPSSIGGRQYTPYAQWKFREFNELPHIFRRRLDESFPVAGEYIDQFPKEKVALAMRFVAFVAGSFAAVLVLATVWDPDIFLHFEITPHRTVLFYLGLFGSVLAVARGMVPDAHRVFDPELLMHEVISHTHYMPAEWKGQLHSQKVQTEFGHLFEMKVTIFASELLSVVLTPFILWYSLPPCAPAIIDFFREFTVHVDGLGYVCSFAVFDFKRHGNVQFGAPTEINDERMMSKEGKMEKSFLNFKVHNPDWNPTDPSGSAYLSRLADLHHNASASTIARTHGPLTRLRSNRSRSGRSFFAPGGGGYAIGTGSTGGPVKHSDPPHVGTSDVAGGMGTGTGTGLTPQPSLHETRLAEKAVVYERALQRSITASMARKRATSLGVPMMTPIDKGKAPEQSESAVLPGSEQHQEEHAAVDLQQSQSHDHQDEEEEGLEGEIGSELGDSYVHGTRTRGPREYYDENASAIGREEDGELGLGGGGVMNMLQQIYNTQRRVVG